ncbi:DUF4351 domain-containing protein [Nocardia alni]|uniref:DUF4351 domain-containing protein n=1 Tax=Nocardia alni TaxID=2815723 RepID=UPI001C21E581|nr:DUF4351 domain-containing protein [Nocardia alni]
MHDLDPVLEKLGPHAEEVVEGRAEGRAESVLTLVAAKFGAVPDWVRRVVDAASVAQLDVWTVRALTASTPEELFAP